MQLRPKILFVTSHWPLAPEYGAQQRALNLLRLLGRFGDVSLVVVEAEPVGEETVRRTRREFDVRRIMRPVPAAPGSVGGHIRHRIRHELDAAYLATDPVAVSNLDRNALLDLMQEHDLTWVYDVKLANWFRIDRWPCSVLDVNDLPSRVYFSAARAGGSLVRRLLNLRMSLLWRRREQLLTERFDVLTVCSENDRQYLGSHPKVHVIPNGFSLQKARPQASSGLHRIGFIGTFNWAPNEEGMNWFIREAWPIIKQESPQAQLRLVGRGSDTNFSRLGADITGLGWLEDPGEEIATWSAMIVPIRVGGGTRVKVVEGFARKCPEVATRLGAFGFDVRNGVEVLLEDRANDFAAACIRLLGDPEMGEALARRAHRRFVQEWTWDSFEDRVGTVIEQCLAASKGKSNGQTPRVVPRPIAVAVAPGRVSHSVIQDEISEVDGR